MRLFGDIVFTNFTFLITGMVSSRTVLVFEDSSRTNSFGLGLECLASKVVFHGLDIKLHNLCAVTDKFFGCFFPFHGLWRVTGTYLLNLLNFMTRSARLMYSAKAD